MEQFGMVDEFADVVDEDEGLPGHLVANSLQHFLLDFGWLAEEHIFVCNSK